MYGDYILCTTWLVARSTARVQKTILDCPYIIWSEKGTGTRIYITQVPESCGKYVVATVYTGIVYP